MHSLPVHINPFFFSTLSGRPPLSLICAPCEHVHLFLPERRRDARCLGLIVPNSPFYLSYLFRALSVNLNPTNKNDTSKTHCSDTFSAQASFFRLFFHLYTYLSLSLSIYIYIHVYLYRYNLFCFLLLFISFCFIFYLSTWILLFSVVRGSCPPFSSFALACFFFFVCLYTRGANCI